MLTGVVFHHPAVGKSCGRLLGGLVTGRRVAGSAAARATSSSRLFSSAKVEDDQQHDDDDLVVAEEEPIAALTGMVKKSARDLNDLPINFADIMRAEGTTAIT